MQYLLIFATLATTTRSTTTFGINLIDELCNDGGKWFLAAAGGNAVDAPLPSKTCVELILTDTDKKSDCIFNTYNHTIHRVNMLKLVGKDEENNTEVYSVGAFHQWSDPALVLPGANPISFNSMAKSTICWDPNTFRFKSYTFTATVIAQDPFISKKGKLSYYIYLIGVNCRMRRSEIHSALLTKQKTAKRDVENMIKKLERMFKNEFPPLTTKCTAEYIMAEENDQLNGFLNGNY